jgi:DNA topoisomerase-1
MTAGSCPHCGKDLRIIYSRAGKRFLGCSGYPDCKQTYPLPQYGKFAPTGDKCVSCGAPVLQIWMRGQSWKSCANMECPSKKKDTKEKKEGGAAVKKVAAKAVTKKTAAKKTQTKKAAPKKAPAKKAAVKKAAAPTAAAD